MAPPAAQKKPKAHTTPCNTELKSGVMRLSRGRMFHKRGLWQVEKWKKQNEKKTAAPKKTTTRLVEKKVGGEKNGGKRLVRASRFPKHYPTEERPRKLRTNKKTFSAHKHTLRPSLVPGTVVILLAGRHAGKRVVFLKQLQSGLLLVSGPYKVNGCPLRRINQIYVIATSARVDLSKVNVPENLNDKFFDRVKAKKQKPTEAEIFETKKEGYSLTEERKNAQLNVDKQLLAAFKSHPDRRLLVSYLRTPFGLTNRQYPHKMKF
jgi:large subunit ribosomal protein L6e